MIRLFVILPPPPHPINSTNRFFSLVFPFSPPPPPVKVGIDQDLPGGPVLFIWPPSPANDKPWRKYQHMYLPFAYSLLFVLWRVDSVKVSQSAAMFLFLLDVCLPFFFCAFIFICSVERYIPVMIFSFRSVYLVRARNPIHPTHSLGGAREPQHQRIAGARRPLRPRRARSAIDRFPACRALVGLGQRDHCHGADFLMTTTKMNLCEEN